MSLLERANECCDDLLADPAVAGLAARIEARGDELREPLRVAVSGQVSAGKSTLVNALVGRPIAETGQSETTEVNAWFRRGTSEAVVLRRLGGGELRLPLEPGRALKLPADFDRDHLAPITYFLDEPLLGDFTIIDTPGLFSPNQEKSERTEALLAERTTRAANVANALVYLTQEVPGAATDDRQLAAFNGLFGGLGAKAPTNSVLVLSKIDEKWDSEGDDARAPFEIARDLVARHGAELWRRVWDTRPVIGHLAELGRGGGGLSQRDFDALAAMARFPRRRRLLGSEAGLRRAGLPEVAVETRLELRRRLGDYGLFRALELIDAGADGPTELDEGLLGASGLLGVVSLVDEVFRERADLIRADSVLTGIERDALSGHGGIGRQGTARVLERIERVRLGRDARPLRRLWVMRLACDVHDRRVRLGDERRMELRALMADGPPAARLGADPDTPGEELAALARRRLRWWRAKENQEPITPTLQEIAQEACAAYQALAHSLERPVAA
jgi:Dynamin family